MAFAGGFVPRPYTKQLDPLRRWVPRTVLYEDDFEAAMLKWIQGDGTVSRNTTAPFALQGNASMQLRTAAVAGNTATAIASVSHVGMHAFVAELWWAWSSVSTRLRQVEFWWVVDDKFFRKFLKVRYKKFVATVETNKWVYVDTNGVEQDVPDGSQNLYNNVTTSAIGFAVNAPLWHYLRLHGDFRKTPAELVELHSDDLDLTELALPGETMDTRQDQHGFRIRFTTDEAAALDGFVDLFLLSDEST